MRGTLRTHITSISIVIFAIVYCYLNYLKPAFLYNKNGTLREFGIGFKFYYSLLLYSLGTFTLFCSESFKTLLYASLSFFMS